MFSAKNCQYVDFEIESRQDNKVVVIMEKIVRIGKMENQDDLRRDDIRKMSPNRRVDMMLKMQHQFFNWAMNPKIERIATIKKMNCR